MQTAKNNTKQNLRDHPAFPVNPFPGDDQNPRVRSNTGMSVMDFYSGMALSGLAGLELSPEETATTAFDLAIAMMVERSLRHARG
jgi:hypothetical protein